MEKISFSLFRKQGVSILSTGLLLAMIITFGCKDSVVNQGLGEDISQPVISVANINPQDTLTVNYSYAGTFLDFRFMDETGLMEYNIDIKLEDSTILNITNQALGTLSDYSVDISSLETNKLYQVVATVIDAANNTASLAFGLQVFFQDALVDYEQLYVVGSATSGGYDLALQSPMLVDRNNPNIYTWTDTLTSGEFKIKTYSEQDFCGGDWIHPAIQNQELDDTAYEIKTGCAVDNPDYKWNIDEAGIYTIKVNFLEEVIQISQDLLIGETFSEIFLVGSATPGGWDLASQTSLTQNSQNEFEFNWSGELVEGEFKFKVYADNDFCGGRWIHPKTSSQSLNDNEFDLLEGCADNNPDYKWIISGNDAGNYAIQINMASKSININKQ